MKGRGRPDHGPILAATAEDVLVYFDYENEEKMRIPDALRTLLSV